MDAIKVPGRRFGLTADTHDVKVDWPEVLEALKAAWGKVDAILHCGDLTSETALRNLGEFAPIYASRSSVDPPAAPPTLGDGPRVLILGGARVGLTFVLAEEEMNADATDRLFGGPVAVCVYGGTHEARIHESEGVLFVNPGSPSLARTRTAAVLTVSNGLPRAEVVGVQ